MSEFKRSKSLLRALLPGSLSDRQQFRDAVGLGAVLLGALVAFEVTRWIGIRVMFWICVVGVVLIGAGLLSALAFQLANSDARDGFLASWRAYRSARKNGLVIQEPKEPDQG